MRAGMRKARVNRGKSKVPSFPFFKGDIYITDLHDAGGEDRAEFQGRKTKKSGSPKLLNAEESA